MKKKVHVVHAWGLPGVVVESSVIEERPDRVVEEHRALLDAAVRSLQRRFSDVDIESDVVRSSPVNALLGHAERAALIVIGTHHQGVLAGGLTGAVAQDLLWRPARQAGAPMARRPPREGARPAPRLKEPRGEPRRSGRPIPPPGPTRPTREAIP